MYHILLYSGEMGKFGGGVGPAGSGTGCQLVKEDELRLCGFVKIPGISVVRKDVFHKKSSEFRQGKALSRALFHAVIQGKKLFHHGFLYTQGGRELFRRHLFLNSLCIREPGQHGKLFQRSIIHIGGEQGIFGNILLHEGYEGREGHSGRLIAL